MNNSDKRYLQRTVCPAQTTELGTEQVSDILHRAGHEIGNPLTSIISLASMMQRFKPEAGTGSRYAGSIISEAWKVGAIIEKLVLLASTRAIAQEPLSPVSLVEKANTRLRSRSTFCLDDVIIRVESDDQSPCTSDSEQLVAALSELLSNALRAIQNDEVSMGPIISITNDGTQFAFEFTNTITTPLPELANLAQPLERAVPQSSGVGIGLPTVARIAQRLGGALELAEYLDSNDQRYFSATLTINKANNENTSTDSPTTESKERTTPNEKPPKHLLIVEDQAPVASAICKILELAFRDQWQLHCSCVKGKEAFEILSSDTLVDAILCDCQLQNLQGGSIYDWVEKQRPDLLDSFAFMTGGVLPERYSNNACLQKPFEPEELIAVVSSLIKTKKTNN